MKARSHRPWLLAAQLFVAVSLLILGAVSCAQSNAGGCNACPPTGKAITAEECAAAGKAAGCETALLTQHNGEADGGQACGAGNPYPSCDWTNCQGEVPIQCN